MSSQMDYLMEDISKEYDELRGQGPYETADETLDRAINNCAVIESPDQVAEYRKYYRFWCFKEMKNSEVA